MQKRLNHIPIVFVDVETNGRAIANGGRIIDIGVIRVERGEIVSTMNQLVYPGHPVPGFITGLTGITDNMLWGQPSFHSIADELSNILRGAIFAAHCVGFDYGHVKAEFERAGLSYEACRFDTVKLSRRIFGGYGHSLAKVIERLGSQPEFRHRGFDDAMVLKELFDYGCDTFGELETLRLIKSLLIAQNKLPAYA